MVAATVPVAETEEAVQVVLEMEADAESDEIQDEDHEVHELDARVDELDTQKE